MPRVKETTAMPVLRVARLGTPLLRKRSAEVERAALRDRALDDFLADMESTMREYGGTGLAAPQVYTPQRVVLYEVAPDRRSRKVKEVPLTALVNPVIEVIDPTPELEVEGCLSVPFLTGKVARPRKIRVQAYGMHGEELEITAEGFHARVILHEVDHLDGVVYVDRVDPKTIQYTIDF
jgi:peptide deformylase